MRPAPAGPTIGDAMFAELDDFLTVAEKKDKPSVKDGLSERKPLHEPWERNGVVQTPRTHVVKREE